MDCNAVSNKIVTMTVASNSLAKIGIKMSVSTLCRYSQRPADTPLPTSGSMPFFSLEAEVNMFNTVVVIKLLKACVTRHNVMDISNFMHKGNTTAKRFHNESVLAGWYQAWLSQMIENGILKRYSGTVPHEVTREDWGTSSNLEDSYKPHASDLVNTGIAEHNTSYDDTVEGPEEIIVNHPYHII